VVSCVEGTPTPDTTCDGVDEDCDGSVDEHWVAGTCGVGACEATETCVSGVESCVEGTPTPDNDCDGIDDDCDGSTDEHWVAGTCGVGACLATETCVSGVESCTPGSPTSDANCNGVDNDCDGETDEHYVPYTCGSCPDLSECISGTASCSADTWCNDDGHATLIGHDYFASNTDVDRIVGNAVFLTTATGTVQVLGYTQYADTSGTGEVANTNAAIDARASALGRTWRLQTFDDYTQLDTLLPGYHVLLVYEQESGSTTLMQTVGTAWASTLDSFVNGGGVVVVADYSGSSWEILDTSGLMTITASAGVSSGTSLTIAAPGDAVATGVSNPYTATNGSRSYTTSDTVVVSQTSTAAPVVVHKEFTSGGGCDTYSETFVNGSTPSAQCTSWNSWRAGLSSSGYSTVTMSGTYDTTGITCSDPATAQAIADAIRTLTSGSWSCDGHTWYLCGTRYTGELWIDAPSLCSGANCPNPGYILRPCCGHSNWGGVNTATCTSNPTQNMTLEFCGSGSSSPTIIEDFETGTWPWSPWVVNASGGTVSSTAAHDGSRGIYNPGWHYRTDVTFGSTIGQKLAWWVSFSSTTGRAYLGFASSSSGTRSFVVAPNTTNLIFQNNVSYGFSNVSEVAQTYSLTTWYKAEVEYNGGGSYTGRLYASDGTTLLNTLAVDYGSAQPGGVAIRGFGNQGLDTIMTY
jgi:hypothetical protein